jgi:hypothetical protein
MLRLRAYARSRGWTRDGHHGAFVELSQHRVLAGCYFQAHQPLHFLRHMMKSPRYDVRNFAYFAAYPWRLLSWARTRRATPAA